MYQKRVVLYLISYKWVINKEGVLIVLESKGWEEEDDRLLTIRKFVRDLNVFFRGFIGLLKGSLSID